MSQKISVFRSPEGETKYYAAYDATLKQWPVPYEDLIIATGFGDTTLLPVG